MTARVVEESLNLSKKRRKRRKAGPSQSQEIKELLDNVRAALKSKNVEAATQELDKLEKALLKD